MGAPNRSLVAPTANPALEQALQERLARHHALGQHLGGLEPLALRLGLMQNTLMPRVVDPQLLLFAADHGIAVEGFGGPAQATTAEVVRLLLTDQLPIGLFARAQDVDLTVIDCGMAENLVPHEGLLVRKIAYGTRNARVAVGMTLEQAHAGMRAGMQIGEQLRGNVTVLAGLGVGSHESAALLLAGLTDSPVRDLLVSGGEMDAEHLSRLMVVMKGAQARHRDVRDPIELLAALGGFEVAVMVGVMLVAASKRHLLLIDGLPACAALMLASRIAQAVTDYCVFARSHSHRGLDKALGLFRASALLELGLETTDGAGAVLALPLIRSAASLLQDPFEAAEGDPPPFSETEPEPAGSPFGEALY